jgi:serine/threonine protein phosphatase PrpC
LPDVPLDSPAQNQAAGSSVAARFIYRATQSEDDASDPLINCWLERLDASVRLSGGLALPHSAWSSDLRSRRGNVRSTNEDFGIGFQVHDLHVVLIADGCGGVPYGFQASRIAVCAAAAKVVDGLTVPIDDASRESAVRGAFAFAAEKLADAARIYALADDGQSLLQTTLIIAVASTSSFTLGYIGDGGAVLVRPRDGTETHVLTPMKAENGVPNVLAAVLGPQILGGPAVMTFQRQPGDLLVMGTDGVWDFVPGSFSKQLMREIMLRHGRVGDALDAALDLLAGHQDDLGHVCSDNLTLAVLAPGGERPRFGPGYWKVAAQAGPAPVTTPIHEQEGVPC